MSEIPLHNEDLTEQLGEKSSALYGKEIEGLKKKWEVIFDTNNSGDDRVEALLLGMGWILNSKFVDGDNICKKVEKLSIIKVREEFLEKLILIMKPVIDFMSNQPEQFEVLQREIQEKKDSIVVNEVFYYKIDGSKIIINILPSKTLGPIKMRRLFLEGLRYLQKAVKENDTINEIEGTSWIIFEKPKLVEKFGFQIINVSEFTKESSATISREDFIAQKYLE